MNEKRHLTIAPLALLLSLLGAATLAEPEFISDYPAPGNMRFNWIHGSISAQANSDVRIQVHRYNEHTYILRQNPAIHWEAPFMYLVFGKTQAVLLDTGATTEGEYFPLRNTVDTIIARWQRANQVDSLELSVLPLGSDFSQNQGAAQFADRPKTKVLSVGSFQREQLLARGTLDLGGRSLSLLPTPGLDEHAVCLYDSWTDFLFTGNAFYPGRLVIRDFEAYKSSLLSLLAFKNENAVKWLMGGRIEMSDYPGVDYRLRSNFRPREHALQLEAALLDEAYQVVQLMNGSTDIRIHDHFIILNGVGRGARDYGYPVYTPERFRQVRLR
ncbi:MAG: MBL fold metallo-hydrolase [Pseudomonadota bacterium]